MPKIAKELTERDVKLLTKPGKYAVGGVDGLIFRIIGNSKAWVFRTRVDGRRREFGLGGYPMITLSRAREKAAQMKFDTERGHDPGQERERRYQENVQRSRAEQLYGTSDATHLPTDPVIWKYAKLSPRDKSKFARLFEIVFED